MSVSRVGGAAQLPAYRTIAGNLKLAYSQFEELEAFSRFGTRLDDNTRKIIEHGERLRACLKQPQFEAVPVLEQITVLLALTAGLFDELPLERTADIERALRAATAQIPADASQRCLQNVKLSDADHSTILQIATAALVAIKKKQ